MKKFGNWLIGGLVGIVTLILLWLVLLLIFQSVEHVAPRSAQVSEMLILVSVFGSLLIGIAVSCWVTARLNRALPAGGSQSAGTRVLAQLRVGVRPLCVARDIFIMLVLGGHYGFITTLAIIEAEGEGQAHMVLGFLNIWSTLISFTLASLLTPQRRWTHLLVVAIAAWLVGVVNVLILGITWDEWLASLIVLLIAMGVGGAIGVALMNLRQALVYRPSSSPPSELQFKCPNCGVLIACPATLAGRRIACGHCGQAIDAPPAAARTPSPKRQAVVQRNLLLLGSMSLIVVLFCGGFAWSLRQIQFERLQARTTAVKMQLIVRALRSYHQDYGCYPPAVVRGPRPSLLDTVNARPSTVHDPRGMPLYSWRVLLLPYLKEHELAAQFHYREPWNSPANQLLATQMPHCFQAGFDEPQAREQGTSFLLISGEGTIFSHDSLRRASDLTDGAARTICLAEVPDSQVPWSAPIDLDLPTLCRSGVTPDGQRSVLNHWRRIMRVAMFDGSVIDANEQFTLEQWQARCRPQDGQ